MGFASDTSKLRRGSDLYPRQYPSVPLKLLPKPGRKLASDRNHGT